MEAERGDGPRADAHWMRRALTLARRHAGRTWPNPTVGACIVRDGRLLAEAAHLRAGGAHAEAAALATVGGDARGATVYVTLEPCHHHGRTPPCSQALARAGVARVVYAVADHSARHPGGGAAWLRARGVRVEEGPLGREAWELNHPFFETSSDDEVHVTLKLALSLDGRLGPESGPVTDPRRRRVSGAAAQRRVHRMRAGARAVLVGRRTAEFDRPRLDVRLLPKGSWEGPGPRPVVLDPALRLDPRNLPPGSLVLHRDHVTGAGKVRSAGHEPVSVAADAEGRLAWPAILDCLLRRDLGIVLVEGGALLATDLLAAATPHRVHLFLAPRLLGGDGPQLVGPAGLDESYTTLRVRRVAEDAEWVLRRRGLPGPPR